MQVTIHLLVSYRRYLPAAHRGSGKYSEDIAPGTRVRDILGGLAIPPDDPGTCLVNGRHAELDQELQDGDVLTIFPAVGGG